MTKWQLMQALTGGSVETVVFGTDGRYRGIVQSVEREDGSGRSFNVRVLVAGVVRMVYVKTVD